MNDIVYQTNIYSSKILGKPIDTNPSEITDFLSIIMTMGVNTFTGHGGLLVWC